MKLIGMELRVGVGNGWKVLEAKLVPVEIVIPSVGYDEPEAEVTFHCDQGDVTTQRIRLPSIRGRDNQEFHHNPQAAHDWLEKYLQSVRV